MGLGNIGVTKTGEDSSHCFIYFSFHLGTNKAATIEGEEGINVIVFHCTLPAIIALLPSGRFDEWQPQLFKGSRSKMSLFLYF